MGGTILFTCLEIWVSLEVLKFLHIKGSVTSLLELVEVFISLSVRLLRLGFLGFCKLVVNNSHLYLRVYSFGLICILFVFLC
ncbi:hypothetical protein HanHA300_Chr15g0577021 [Helianthus annuus]|nr:hypothetical protein HanHA300_Chr15g0577021 [Helianthus annuus]KAJ0650874.1 hypothetical protein HanOQP8_Chr15g0555021 [Helianthus annuus]